MRLELEEEHALGLRRAARAPRRAARAGSRAASRRRAAPRAAPRPAPSSRGSSRTRRRRSGTPARPTPDGRAACRSCARCSSSTTSSSGERRPRELEPRLGRRRRPSLWPGRRGDEHDARDRGRAPPSPCRSERDVAVVRRVERAAEEPDHGTNSNVSSPTSTSSPARAPAARSARSSSSSLGGVPTHAEAALGAQQAPRPRLRLRAVDEEVRQLVVRLGARPRARARARTAGARKSSMPVAGRARERGRPRPRARPRRRTSRLGHEVDLVQHDDLRPLVEAGAVGGELARRSSRHCSSTGFDASITCTSMRARSRCARNSWPSPTPSLAPSISPGRRRRRAGGRRAPRPCRAPAAAS